MQKSVQVPIIASSSDKLLFHHGDNPQPLNTVESLSEITAVAWSHNSKFNLSNSGRSYRGN